MTLQGNYLEAECVDVDPVGKTITCQYNKPFRGQSDISGRTFNVPYDVLVVAVSFCFVLYALCNCSWTTSSAEAPTGKLMFVKQASEAYITLDCNIAALHSTACDCSIQVLMSWQHLFKGLVPGMLCIRCCK